MNRDYVWHPLAKIWQTPLIGEQWMADLKDEEFASLLRDHGVPAELAPEIVSKMDATMKALSSGSIALP